MRNWTAALLVTFLGFLLIACQGSAPASPAPTPPELPVPTSPQVSASESQPVSLSSGQELFIAKGCSACHGQNAEGTDFAPALPGHTAAVVKRQVRAPLGIMPVFPPDKVSNEELEAISEFIEGLGEGHAHVRAPGSPDEIALHHWMALFSVDAEDPSEAIHHLGHIIALTEGQHRSRMEEAVTLLEQNELDDATHVIQQMLAGLEQVDIDEPTMQLTLALSSVRVEEANIAIHHVEHFLETATATDTEAGERIVGFLREERIHDAEDGLEELLGGTPVEEHEDEEEPGEGDDDEDESAPSAPN